MELTFHAQLRCDQRRISMADINLVIDNGVRIHNGGALFCYMRRKDLPGDLPSHEGSRLEGLTVVVDSTDETVITIYRNRQGLHDIKRKSKRWVDRHECASKAA